MLVCLLSLPKLIFKALRIGLESGEEITTQKLVFNILIHVLLWYQLCNTNAPATMISCTMV